MASNRETYVEIAKLAEHARRYNDMVESMKNIAKLNVELTIEEKQLLSDGYKNLVGARKTSLGIISDIEHEEEGRENEPNAKLIKEYRQKVEAEISGICCDIVTVIIEEHKMKEGSCHYQWASTPADADLMQLLKDNLTLWTSHNGDGGMGDLDMDLILNAEIKKWSSKECLEGNMTQAEQFEHNIQQSQERREAERVAQHQVNLLVQKRAKAALEKLRRAEERLKMYKNKAKHENKLIDQKNERGRVCKIEKSVKKGR